MLTAGDIDRLKETFVTKEEFYKNSRDMMGYINVLNEATNQRMDSLEKRMDAVEKRLEIIEKRLDKIEHTLDQILGLIVDVRQDMHEQRNRLFAIEQKLN